MDARTGRSSRVVKQIARDRRARARACACRFSTRRFRATTSIIYTARSTRRSSLCIPITRNICSTATWWRCAATRIRRSIPGFSARCCGLYGDVREVPFHLAYSIFSIIAALAMLSLARRFCDKPFLATLLFIAVPAFVVNGNSLETDLPFLALWMLAIAWFVKGVEENSTLALIGRRASRGNRRVGRLSSRLPRPDSRVLSLAKKEPQRVRMVRDIRCPGRDRRMANLRTRHRRSDARRRSVGLHAQVRLAGRSRKK